MAKSVRYSCAIFQKPLSIKIGSLVVINAVVIIVNRGMDASLVNKPNKTSEPQTISRFATK